jgi:coenzyme F420-reducing hydrogenase delta subunit
MPVLRALLAFTGIESERLLFKWIAASEGGPFVQTVAEFTERLRQLPPLREVLKQAEPPEF